MELHEAVDHLETRGVYPSRAPKLNARNSVHLVLREYVPVANQKEPQQVIEPVNSKVGDKSDDRGERFETNHDCALLSRGRKVRRNFQAFFVVKRNCIYQRKKSLKKKNP